MKAHPRHFQQRAGHRLLDGFDAGLLAEVVRPQQAEVVVRVCVVERQDQVDKRLATARIYKCSSFQRGCRSESSLTPALVASVLFDASP